METFDSLDGALLIDKPSGPTSHDIVDSIRRQFRLKKVGHCGTLDPNATGLLVILLGRATKLSEKLMGADKVYEGVAKLGEATNTYDLDGEITASLPVPPLTLDELNAEATTFVGDLLQPPPMVSAAKIGGVPLYKLARKGIEVERKPRLVHIYSFAFSSYSEPMASFRMSCTKGTYVRSVIHDLGQKVGCGAHLFALRRTDVGRFSITQAISLAQALEMPISEIERRVIPFLKLAAAESAT